ncbi:MAG: threonylcarbamoyl-AMP synthase [Bacteroidetes bacterium RIFOXYA12_FULL_35_11]|nr:MAG: threonylcarbamoyl-AMP synthase [Bacteroidetes bacterium RIFOXYA12_FULL_35_11]
MLLKIHPETPASRAILKAVEVLRDGGLIIYPTDTVYGLGCDIFNSKGIERIAQIKNIDPEKAHFSFICYDLSNISEYTRQIDNHVFKIMKKNLPGPFTFILHSNSNVPKILKSKKKTIGIRIPDNNIIREIVKELGHPIITTSVIALDDIIEYTTDPELIHEEYCERVDLVIDGGYGNNVPAAIIDCTGDEIEIIREGILPLQM